MIIYLFLGYLIIAGLISGILITLFPNPKEPASLFLICTLWPVTLPIWVVAVATSYSLKKFVK